MTCPACHRFPLKRLGSANAEGQVKARCTKCKKVWRFKGRYPRPMDDDLTIDTSIPWWYQ